MAKCRNCVRSRDVTLFSFVLAVSSNHEWTNVLFRASQSYERILWTGERKWTGRVCFDFPRVAMGVLYGLFSLQVIRLPYVYIALWAIFFKAFSYIYLSFASIKNFSLLVWSSLWVKSITLKNGDYGGGDGSVALPAIIFYKVTLLFLFRLFAPMITVTISHELLFSVFILFYVRHWFIGFRRYPYHEERHFDLIIVLSFHSFPIPFCLFLPFSPFP